MKKTSILCIIAVLGCILVSCGNEADNSNNTEATKESVVVEIDTGTSEESIEHKKNINETQETQEETAETTEESTNKLEEQQEKQEKTKYLKDKVSIEYDSFNDGYIEDITNMMVDHYDTLIDFNLNKNCLISGNSPKDVPTTITVDDNNVIAFLTEKDDKYWAHVIYQLSHEMTHYVIGEESADVEYVPWCEETICEAMSYYFLEYFSEHWGECSLSSINEEYADALSDYTYEAIDLSMEGYEELEFDLYTATPKQLKIINDEAMTNRTYRAEAAAMLHEAIEKSEDVTGLLHYRDFINEETLLLDIDRYREAYPDNMAVDFLCMLSEDIEDRG